LIQKGRFCGVVQVIGKSSVASKYKSEFTFRVPNGIEQISEALFVRLYTEYLRQVSENSAQHVGQHWTLFPPVADVVAVCTQLYGWHHVLHAHRSLQFYQLFLNVFTRITYFKICYVLS
jgi:hypothetical protein